MFKVAGPRTLRLSSNQILPRRIIFNGKSVVKGWGSNLQNVEKSMRAIYEADEGKILVQPDQSGAEALVVAYCCENGNYRQLFINGIKPHTYLAMQLFKDVWPKKMIEHNIITGDSQFDIDELINTPIPLLRQNPFWNDLARLIKDSDDWDLTERYYYLAKQTEHSSSYDVQPPTFRMNTLEKSGGKIVISKEDSERFLMTKFALFPEIKGYHKWVRQCAESGKMLFNLHGHPYQLTSYEILETQLKEMYAWIPQSTVGEITNIAYTKMYEYIERNHLDWDLLTNTHDSYLLQCPVGEEKECGRMAQQFLCQTFKSPIDGVEFSMKSEVVSGQNWAPYHKNKNPDGLKELAL